MGGHNEFSGTDEFGRLSNLVQRESEFGLFECQTQLLITVNGDLRDVGFERALRDTTKMLSRLSSRLWVTDCLLSVSCDYEDKKFIFSDPQWVLEREVTDWARNLAWKYTDDSSKEEHYEQ